MKSPLSCLTLLLVVSLLSSASFAGGAKLPVSTDDQAQSPQAQFVIPGPQRSFLRMAGISQKVVPAEVLPLLARNVFTEGYEGSSRPTEFLILLRRYVGQARDLAALAAQTGNVIRVSNCQDAGPLLHILGYRIREDCGRPETSLQTEDPEKAFLSIDSGFPLPELEQTLQGGKPFEYPYASSAVPVLFTEDDWIKANAKNNKEYRRDLLDTMLNDPEIARLYWAMSRMDSETSHALDQSIGLAKLLPYGGVLDFYGRELRVRDGRVEVPGGMGSEIAWRDLAGGTPESAATFVPKLVARDKGWLAAYFDVLSRSTGEQRAYFTNPRRMRLFYEGLRAPDPSFPATRGSFRPAPALLLLVTRLQFDKGGDPIVPGGLDAWKEILQERSNVKLVRGWGKQTQNLTNTDRLLQMMFALSRAPVEAGPVQMYMGLSELDSRRPPERRLQPDTVLLMAKNYEAFSDQYRIFSEFPELDDHSIAMFLDVAQEMTDVPMAMRGNALGTLQAQIGIWQILARQGQIPAAQLNDSWQAVVKPFAKIHSGAELYDAGRASLAAIFQASTGKATGSQDEIIDLLAGPRQSSAEGKQMHREVADRIRSVLDDQRLVSLDTVLTVGDALTGKQHGKQPPEYVAMMAAQTKEFEMPQRIFTNTERSEWATGVYNNHHTEVQMKSDLPKVLKSPSASRGQIEDAKAQISSFLRDTLVGLNYAYYEPPGAQALHNNPLLVRSHDFAGETLGGVKYLWQAPDLLGQGSPAGGGAHFVGSLADLPYALAELEQDFISPENVQALIWSELTPELLTSSVLPRWWDVSPVELHAVALYQRSGEELLAAAAKDEALRGKVMAILSNRLLPQQSFDVGQKLRAGQEKEVVAHLMPADTFYLAQEFQEKYPNQPGEGGSATQELADLCRQHPDQVNWQRLSHDFGTPHPSIAQNYGTELLNLLPMPSFSGYSSRFLAESWDSPNLYWARLADEGGYSPVMLNALVPELTRVMVKKIFATEFEDWPALLRAMHETAADFRQGKLSQISTAEARGITKPVADR